MEVIMISERKKRTTGFNRHARFLFLSGRRDKVY